MAKCEACGIVDNKSKFKKNKRFCSIACSKRYAKLGFFIETLIDFTSIHFIN